MENNNFEIITDLMPEGWENAAKELGAFTRSRVIENPAELLELLLLYSTSGGSFGKTAAMLKFTQEKSLNKNAVYERVLKSKDWLLWLCVNLCTNAGFLCPAPLWLQGRRVCLVDATDEAKPGSNGADFRLHYLIDLFRLTLVDMHLTPASEGEKLTRFQNIQQADLIIGDRAYGTLTGIAHLKQSGADFVLRLRANAFNLYLSNGEEASLTELLKEVSVGKSASFDLFYKVNKKLEPIRICALGKDEQAQKRGINQIKKSNSRKMRGKVSSTQEFFNRYIIVATSLSEEDAGANQILELYRMRWQIELVFKRFKSIFHYGELLSRKEDSAYAWFYGKLLVAAICEALVNEGRFSPLPK